LQEIEKKEHIPLRENNTETRKKAKKRFFPSIKIEDLPEHSEILVHTAVMNELGITVRDIERIRIR